MSAIQSNRRLRDPDASGQKSVQTTLSNLLESDVEKKKTQIIK